MKIYHKLKKSNGEREVYIAGVKLFTYRMKKNKPYKHKRVGEKNKIQTLFAKESYGMIRGRYMCSSAELLAIPSEKLRLPEFERPMVSIIIPAYNKIGLNLQCIRSIIKNTCHISYEVIIADDCSTDATSHIENYVEGVRRITTSETSLFLKNCNYAAKYARGKYVCFLNNDTLVQYDWLQPLVDCLESDPSIGLCGSKLIFADGSLQEAGGIIYRDGSGNNFGRGQNPNAIEFNYMREVDYISGAAILLSRKLWEDLGGFDERYALAYYEDTDLAFRVRYEKGLKVVYQPASVVMHLEGQSNGTDLNSGVKAYQVRNQQVFYQKWKKELDAYHVAPTRYIAKAKDRAQNTKTVLVVDFDLLMPFNDTGSRATWQYMHYWQQKGFVVKYYPNRMKTDVSLLKMHLEAGYEVITDLLEEWLKDYGHTVDYVYLNRPNVAVHHIDAIRRYTSAKLIYQGHDLHYLRQYRARVVAGDSAAEQLLVEEKKLELEVCRKVDVACYFSQFEVDALAKEDATIRATAIPLFVLDPFKMQSIHYEASSRCNLIFVAGFAHKVNVDAVVWFCKEVFPMVLRQVPDVKLYIIGSSPTEDVLALASENVIVTGSVSEERLIEYYRQARLTVVPLRAGAGVKGKVIESVFNKVPVVTTSVGAEGIENPNGILTIEDSADALASTIATLYTDTERLNYLSSLSENFIRDFFSTLCIDRVLSPFIPEIN